MQEVESNTELAVRTVCDATAKTTAYGDLELRCPVCGEGVAKLACGRCGFQMRNIKGVVHAMPPDRVVHFARFVEEYEHIRCAEGRGGESDEFYLGLPYSDASRRNETQWAIRARSFDYLLGRILKPCVGGNERVLDLGAGNCWMSYRLALAGYSPCAVDLLTNDQDGMGAAEHYRSYLPGFFPRFRAEFSRLPFKDEQFKAVVFNASFHYAEDFEASMREALRCCKTDGVVVVCDTPWYSSDESGKKMVRERRRRFLQDFGTESASLTSQEYVTDKRLKHLEESLGIRWEVHAPSFGFKWAMRPWLAKVRKRREPARFRIYIARKASR